MNGLSSCFCQYRVGARDTIPQRPLFYRELVEKNMAMTTSVVL